MHAYAGCLTATASPIEYSSSNEKTIDAGIYIAGRYILKREFGQIDQKTYGTQGTSQFSEIDSGYKWAIVFLKERGTTKEVACAAIEWIDCKELP